MGSSVWVLASDVSFDDAAPVMKTNNMDVIKYFLQGSVFLFEHAH